MQSAKYLMLTLTNPLVWGCLAHDNLNWGSATEYIIQHQFGGSVTWPKFEKHRLLPYLVFYGDLGAQCVVCVPLLREGQAVFGPLVFGLQRPGHLAGLCVGGAPAAELLHMRRAWNGRVDTLTETERSGGIKL